MPLRPGMAAMLLVGAAAGKISLTLPPLITSYMLYRKILTDNVETSFDDFKPGKLQISSGGFSMQRKNLLDTFVLCMVVSSSTLFNF